MKPIYMYWPVLQFEINESAANENRIALLKNTSIH